MFWGRRRGECPSPKTNGISPKLKMLRAETVKLGVGRFPSDEEFHREIQSRDLYNFRGRSYWLRRLENFEHKERVSVDEYTIEHILPQNENLSPAWRADLGPEWERIRATWLHTLGNLTLTGYNSEYSDRPFAEKRDMSGGFKYSPIKLNEGLGQLEAWTEEAIVERAEKLAEKVLAVWVAPRVPPDILEAYRSRPAASGCSIEDHQHLLSPPMRELFEAFRREVLALDPGVTEEFFRSYIAYKAETNFVDVVPQAKALHLSLNMAFSEISDPKRLCRDVTNMRRGTNGDVEVKLSSLEELPYILGLVRQALERQLGSGDDT